MGSIRGFRCGQCRAELLATRGPAAYTGKPEWSPPLLCCGQPLQGMDPDQVLSVIPIRRRVARCPRCEYQVRLIVHPARSLVCMSCQTDLIVIIQTPVRSDRLMASVEPARAVRK